MKHASFRVSVSRRDGIPMSVEEVELVTDFISMFAKLSLPIRGMQREGGFVDYSVNGLVTDDYETAVFENRLFRQAPQLQFVMFTSNLAVVPSYDIFTCHQCDEEMRKKAISTFFREVASNANWAKSYQCPWELDNAG